MRWMLQLKVSTPHEGSANHVHPAGAIQPRPSPMAGEPSRHACNPVVSVHRLPSTRPRSLWRLASPLHFQAAHKTACCISARTVAMHTQQPNILKPETDCVVKGAHHPGSRRGPPDRDCQTSALVEKRRLQTIAPTTTNRVCKATNDIDEHVHCCMQLIIKSSVPSSFFFFCFAFCWSCVLLPGACKFRVQCLPLCVQVLCCRGLYPDQSCATSLPPASRANEGFCMLYYIYLEKRQSEQSGVQGNNLSIQMAIAGQLRCCASLAEQCHYNCSAFIHYVVKQMCQGLNYS